VRSILRHVRPANVHLARPSDGALESRVRATRPWPEIEGIDSTDVRERLSGDVGLFRSMLERLLNEFSNVAIRAVAEDPIALAAHAGRMHKLKGVAGTLGAKAIQRLAGEAEAACVAGEVKRAAHLATRLASQLQGLRQSASPTLKAARAQAEGSLALLSDGEIEPQVLVDLVDRLRQQSLSVLDRFTSISPQLRRLLGKDSYEVVRNHIDNLQFRDAANALEECLSFGGKPGL
jgi:HPt (histidine-containing phosphotransfer) domain-containing protein